MGAHKRTIDEHLSNGSVIYWSRRNDPYIPVKCGVCGHERCILLNNTTRKTFNGICRQCTNGEQWQDVRLDNGSIVAWSRRNGQLIPVICGKCGHEHINYAASIRKENFTGLCRSCVHSGALSHTWRGGRVDKNGYIYVKVEPSHPFFKAMANNIGYIAEHRLVMAEHMGRPLTSDEVVHHKNGDKHDNRPENLELFVSFREHGLALHRRDPHPGRVPANKLERILTKIKEVLSEDSE
jgi:ribosomal protein S27E